jgi:hypothetical protein
VRFDRKLLLIAPTVVLVFVVAGLIYTAVQLHVLSSVSDSFKERSDFVAAVDRGEKTLDARQAIGLLKWAMEVETKRTAAVQSIRDVMIALSTIALVCCGVLAIGIRSVPREHWPRLNIGRKVAE